MNYIDPYGFESVYINESVYFFPYFLYQSTKARRLSSDDVDAVNRLPFLNNSRYRDLLCEMGGLFSIAYKVDEIHKKPWIGFQSWRTSGRKVCLRARSLVHFLEYNVNLPPYIVFKIIGMIPWKDLYV